MASLCNLNELFLKHLNLETPGQLPSSLLRLYFESFSIRRAELLPSCLRLRNLSTLELIDGEVEDIPLHGLPHLEKLLVSRCKLLQRLFIPSELRKLRRASVFSCPELVEIQVGHLKSLESLWIDKCESLTRLSGLSYLKNLENFTILCCNDQTVVEEFHELQYSDIIEGTSLRKRRIFLLCSREEIPIDTLGKVRHLLH
ncbi:hypothetical protein BT93_C1938 [Corymbia citriodora subsp. variegata]|nr:hypothetical protein BT93_C1938 [Corymbia citriodora subsp. variegata]